LAGLASSGWVFALGCLAWVSIKKWRRGVG
jgi:hypothetical protein